MVTAVVAVFLAAYHGGDINPSRLPGLRILTEFSPLVVALGSCWLGTLAFYGDNVRRRCAFLADRGLSPSHVWWTRLAPSALCLALLLSLAISLRFLPANWRWHGIFSNTRNHPALLPSLLLVGFAFGQLVGQWVRRPTLAFFGAPAYGLFSCMVLFFLFSIYGSYAWTSILMVPVLLFATWRLTRRWLDDRIDGGFHGRVLAYTALATLMPILAIFGHRYATIPAEMPQWRSEMLAIDDPAMTNTDGPRGDWILVASEIRVPRSSIDDDPSRARRIRQVPQNASRGRRTGRNRERLCGSRRHSRGSCCPQPILATSMNCNEPASRYY